MARYIIRATGSGGPTTFYDPLTIDAALVKAAELNEAGFEHIILVNTRTGVEISDLEELIDKKKKGGRPR
jgi:hypothetical protein